MTYHPLYTGPGQPVVYMLEKWIKDLPFRILSMVEEENITE